MPCPPHACTHTCTHAHTTHIIHAPACTRAHLYTCIVCICIVCAPASHTHSLRTCITHMHHTCVYMYPLCVHTCPNICAPTNTHVHLCARYACVCTPSHAAIQTHMHLLALECMCTCELLLASLSDFLHASHQCLKCLLLSPPSHPTHLRPIEQNPHPLLSGADPLFSRSHTHFQTTRSMATGWIQLP